MRQVLSVVSCVLAAAGAVHAQRPAETRAVPIELICGPTATLTPPSQRIRIVSGQERTRTLFAAGDSVIINAGTGAGLRAGQHFFVRRVVEDRFAARTSEKAPVSIHTAGWLTIVEAKEDTSIGRIAEACDGISTGDFLEALAITPAAEARPAGRPDFERPGHVILADDRRQMGAGGGSLMVMDRGTDHGIRVGQRLTLFRRADDGSGTVVTLGDAFVASTTPETSLIRIEKSREAIHVGDLVAIHR
jgi:hypothetical protein